MRRAIWRVASLASGERLAAAAQGAPFLFQSFLLYLFYSAHNTEHREPRTENRESFLLKGTTKHTKQGTKV
jgi:hypothetical protein